MSLRLDKTFQKALQTVTTKTTILVAGISSFDTSSLDECCKIHLMYLTISVTCEIESLAFILMYFDPFVFTRTI